MHITSKVLKYNKIKKEAVNSDGNDSFLHRTHRTNIRKTGSNKMSNLKKKILTKLEQEEYEEQMKLYSR
jgi:hypothetical protein